MSRQIATALFLHIAVASNLLGCTDQQTRSLEIGAYTFVVPREHVVQGSIPWLPSQQRKGLMLRLRPKETSVKEILVLLQSSDDYCAGNRLSNGTQTSGACQRALASINNLHDRTQSRLVRDGDHTQWQYTTEDGTVIASCYAVGHPANGNCTSINNYKKLIVSSTYVEDQRFSGLDVAILVNRQLAEWDNTDLRDR
jgi:hypothetical protein